MAKDLSALVAPPNYAGSDSPIVSDSATQTKVEKAVNSKSLGKQTNASQAAKDTVRLSAALLAAAVILLWILGGIVFRNANL